MARYAGKLLAAAEGFSLWSWAKTKTKTKKYIKKKIYIYITTLRNLVDVGHILIDFIDTTVRKLVDVGHKKGTVFVVNVTD